MRNCWLILVAVSLLATLAACADEGGAWKTIYFKRGFVGNYDANWAGGVGATLRWRLPIPCAGSKVRVFVGGSREEDVVLAKMTLVRGVDAAGKITGPQFPVLFAGQPTLTLEKGGKSAASDPLEAPITPGLWYLQDSYASQKFPYAYEVDTTYAGPADGFDKESLPRPIKGSRLGIVTRVDLFTPDARPTIACWGDSITHGYASTPNAGKRYPELLGARLNRPTLNLGVNGDQAIYAGGAPGVLAGLPGIDTVIFLMGISERLP
jgi:hypothetical protein